MTKDRVCASTPALPASFREAADEVDRVFFQLKGLSYVLVDHLGGREETISADRKDTSLWAVLGAVEENIDGLRPALDRMFAAHLAEMDSVIDKVSP